MVVCPFLAVRNQIPYHEKEFITLRHRLIWLIFCLVIWYYLHNYNLYVTSSVCHTVLASTVTSRLLVLSTVLKYLITFTLWISLPPVTDHHYTHVHLALITLKFRRSIRSDWETHTTYLYVIQKFQALKLYQHWSTVNSLTIIIFIFHSSSTDSVSLPHCPEYPSGIFPILSSSVEMPLIIPQVTLSQPRTLLSHCFYFQRAMLSFYVFHFYTSPTYLLKQPLTFLHLLSSFVAP